MHRKKMPAASRPLSLPDHVHRLLVRLDDAGFDCFVVGGYLRDLMLGRPTHDYDLATSATPEEIAEVFSSYRTIPTGLIHGTMTVMAGTDAVEVTTFRKEGSYSDYRHPDKVWFTLSLEDDLARRDFTINAMAWHPSRGLVDPWDGRADLENRLIRAVGDPGKRFGEDALRVLRALRFSSELGFAIEPVTHRALMKKQDLLCHVAPERLRIELERLLAGPDAPAVLREYAEVMTTVIPALGWLQETAPQGNGTLYDRAVMRVAEVSPDPVLRMAALLYDLEEAGCAGTVRSIGQALRFSRKDTERMIRLVASKTTGLADDERTVWRLLRQWGERGFYHVMELRKADALAGLTPDRVKGLEVEAVLRVAGHLIRTGRNLSLSDLAVDGHDLKARGYRGPAIGERLERLLERVCVDGLPNRKNVLLSDPDPGAAEKGESVPLHP